MSSQPASPATILVVEDEAFLLFAIADDLRDAGFEVLEASNAGQAIAILERRPDVSILFTDIDMPGSMDGLRLSAAVRDRWPPVKVIITSGKRQPAQDAMPVGGVFLPKPYALEAVTATIHGLLVMGK
jgi:DNA-binding NtrC family response regulator